MSKNYELMQGALRQARGDAPFGKDPSKVVFLEAEAEPQVSLPSSTFDAAAQQECFRLVQRLFLTQSSSPFHTVVLTGVDRGDGCSRICVESGRILAASSKSSVCLVDGNLRNPSLASSLGIPDQWGLANSLVEQGAIRSFTKQLQPNLWLLSAGTVDADSPGLLNSDRLKVRLQELRQEFDYILIDSPALNLCPDSLALGALADGVVVVLRADATRRESALKSLQTLRGAKVQVLGAILNQRTFPIPDFVYRRL
jgi:polysaccharide biosynthesis transport protein